MKIKQIHILFVGFVTILSLFAVLLTPVDTNAYKCIGTTNGGTHSYRNGGCYMGSQLVAGDIPVKNDGTPIIDWQCESGTYNAATNTCQRCIGNSCQTLANVAPIPVGEDTTQVPNADGSATDTDTDEIPAGTSSAGECAGVKTDFFACDGDGVDAFGSILTIIIVIVSVGVGIVAVGGLVYGAILYASAQDNQERTKKAIKIVRSVIIGLLLYIFMFAIANWLVPGGIIESGESEEETSQTSESDTTSQNQQ